MWEDDINPNDTIMMRRMSAIGVGQIRIDNRRLWTNSEVILDKMTQEKERRKWSKDNEISPISTKSWGSIIQDATRTQIDRREMSDFEISRENPARAFFAEGVDEKWDAIFYMDSDGEYYDEITNKKLNRNGVIATRLDEIKQVHSHGVYEKVPIEERWAKTGKAPIKTKWVDINKGDKLNEEYRCRLVAKKNQDRQKN